MVKTVKAGRFGYYFVGLLEPISFLILRYILHNINNHPAILLTLHFVLDFPKAIIIPLQKITFLKLAM
jgi:hypothetical protein